jgi:hypothetical protein
VTCDRKNSCCGILERTGSVKGPGSVKVLETRVLELESIELFGGNERLWKVVEV